MKSQYCFSKKTKGTSTASLEENFFPFLVLNCLLINLEELGKHINNPQRASSIKMQVFFVTEVLCNFARAFVP